MYKKNRDEPNLFYQLAIPTENSQDPVIVAMVRDIHLHGKFIDGTSLPCRFKVLQKVEFHFPPGNS